MLHNLAVAELVHHYMRKEEETRRALICSLDQEVWLAQKESVVALVNIQINIFSQALLVCTSETRLRYLVEQKLLMIVSLGAV